MNTNKSLRAKLAIGAAVLAMVVSSLACDDGGTGDVIQNANNSCNDITSCVGTTPQELSNLCQVAGGYHDASGTCVMP
jgi:hypothetical protein